MDGVLVETYLWAGRTVLLAVMDPQGNVIARFDGSKVVLGGVAYYQMRDQVGSLRALVDASGVVVKVVEYDAFGHVVSDSNPGLETYVGFAGGLQDRDTGLVRFGYRDYLPDVGRWTARDPIGIGGGVWDLYTYCHGDSVNKSDPVGLGVKYKLVRMVGDGARKLIKEITEIAREEALVLRRRGSDILVDGEKIQRRAAAELLEKEAFPRGPIIEHVIHGTRPHFHGYFLEAGEWVKASGHTFYGILGFFTARNWLGDSPCSTAIDFFNPASDAIELLEDIGAGTYSQ